MDCIYIAPLSKALYNLYLSFTHSHTNGDWLPCKVPTLHFSSVSHSRGRHQFRGHLYELRRVPSGSGPQCSVSYVFQHQEEWQHGSPRVDVPRLRNQIRELAQVAYLKALTSTGTCTQSTVSSLISAHGGTVVSPDASQGGDAGLESWPAQILPAQSLHALPVTSFRCSGFLLRIDVGLLVKINLQMRVTRAHLYKLKYIFPGE